MDKLILKEFQDFRKWLFSGGCGNPDVTIDSILTWIINRKKNFAHDIIKSWILNRATACPDVCIGDLNDLIVDFISEDINILQYEKVLGPLYKIPAILALQNTALSTEEIYSETHFDSDPYYYNEFGENETVARSGDVLGALQLLEEEGLIKKDKNYWFV